MKRPIAVIQSEPTFNIYWTVTDFCNFRCNYCPPILHSGDFSQKRKEGFPTDEEIKTFLDNLGEKYLKGRKLNVQLSGGEPTLHPMIIYIINRLKEHEGYVGITTNGSKPVDFWNQVLPLGNVTISLQPEFTNIDRINRISRAIVDSGTRLDYNLSCDPKNWDRVLEMYNGLENEFKPFVNPKVLNYIRSFGKNNRQNYEYEPHQEEWMREKIKIAKESRKGSSSIISSHLLFSDGSKINTRALAEITLNNWHDMKGWKCNVGYESINIHFSGQVYAGVCQSKLLGRIDTFELHEDPITCEIARCVCPADLRVNKRLSIS